MVFPYCRVKAKILLQRVWESGIDIDDWLQWRTELPLLSGKISYPSLFIPRWELVTPPKQPMRESFIFV